jgi:16S rRNA processing protein RimM
VVNREGIDLGRVRDLMATGPNSVLCVEYPAQKEDGSSVTAERMIPFVSVYVDTVDIPGKCITVDWQPDY